MIKITYGVEPHSATAVDLATSGEIGDLFKVRFIGLPHEGPARARLFAVFFVSGFQTKNATAAVR